MRSKTLTRVGWAVCFLNLGVGIWALVEGDWEGVFSLIAAAIIAWRFSRHR